jgi:hypothetical protein
MKPITYVFGFDLITDLDPDRCSLCNGRFLRL